MNKHTHFDLVAAEKSLRAGMQSTIAEAMRRAPSDDDRTLVRLQGDLEDFTIAFALWDMGRINNGGQAADPIAADALGYTIGNAIASFVQNSNGGQAIFDMVMESLWRSCMSRLNDEVEEGAINTQTEIPAMQGGNA